MRWSGVCCEECVVRWSGVCCALVRCVLCAGQVCVVRWSDTYICANVHKYVKTHTHMHTHTHTHTCLLTYIRKLWAPPDKLKSCLTKFAIHLISTTL